MSLFCKTKSFVLILETCFFVFFAFSSVIRIVNASFCAKDSPGSVVPASGLALLLSGF